MLHVRPYGTYENLKRFCLKRHEDMICGVHYYLVNSCYAEKVVFKYTRFSLNFVVLCTVQTCKTVVVLSHEHCTRNIVGFLLVFMYSSDRNCFMCNSDLLDCGLDRCMLNSDLSDCGLFCCMLNTACEIVVFIVACSIQTCQTVDFIVACSIQTCQM